VRTASGSVADRGSTVQAALITGRHRVELREFDEPVVGDTDVVVDISLCGVCGTDAHAWASGSPYNPAICGHEWAGTVRAVGAAARDLTAGDRVVVAVPPACGRCGPCRHADPEHCVRVFEAAVGRDAGAPVHGGFAPAIRVDAGRVIHADDRLDDVQCALVEPTTICLHAVRRSRLRLGDHVVVQGAGPIGLLTLQLARVAGAGSVTVVEPDPERRDLACSLGADAAAAPGSEASDLVRERTDGLGADLVFECAGIASVVQTAVGFARRGGSVMLVGYPVDRAEVDIAGWLVQEVTVGTSLAYLRGEFPLAMDLIGAGRIDVAPLHSRTVPLSQLPGVLADLASGGSRERKVLVDPRG